MFVAVAIQTDREKTAEQAAISQSQRGGVSRDAGPANGVTPSTGLGSKSTRGASLIGDCIGCLELLRVTHALPHGLGGTRSSAPPATTPAFVSLHHHHQMASDSPCHAPITSTTLRVLKAFSVDPKENALQELVRRTGYRLAQENGQRTYGPPPDWKGFPPPRGSEVFVGKLPRDLYEDELVPVLEMVGQLYKLRLMMAFSGENRGFAFATYTNCADAETAVRKLNNWYIRPRHRIGVCISKDNCCIFISGLPKDKTKEEVLMEMCCATEGVVDVKMSSYAQSQGYALVEYQNHRAAAMARRRMIPAVMAVEPVLLLRMKILPGGFAVLKFDSQKAVKITCQVLHRSSLLGVQVEVLFATTTREMSPGFPIASPTSTTEPVSSGARTPSHRETTI
ncbi:RNA-binding protein 47-like isoform X6 [Lethenteron reissneri]|uniref:RNA-binding protein 47-like isoform X6 n=1 Tax=Lethenteron reissneri TaxID=7753 RepID=UPI002AB7256D|nr:RNA-binding protein 47-like isoform X6 [Lethenteron reissneri]